MLDKISGSFFPFQGLFLLVLSAATIAASVEDGQKQIESADDLANGGDLEGAESTMQEDHVAAPSRHIERQWKVKPVKKSLPGGGKRVTVHIVETGGSGPKKSAKGTTKTPQKKLQQQKPAPPANPTNAPSTKGKGGSHRIDSHTHSEEIHEIILPAEQEILSSGLSEQVAHFPQTKYEIIAADPVSQETRKEEPPRERIKVKHHHHHHHHNHVKTVVKKVPVEVPVEKVIHVPVEKLVHVPKPYPVEKLVEKIVHVPVEKIVHVPKPVPVEKIVEKVIRVPVPKIIEKPVPVDRIVEKIVHVPKIIEREKKVPVEVKVPFPVEKLVHVPKPYPVEKIVEKVVQVPIPKPYPVIKHIHVPVEVKVPVPIHKPVPVHIERKIKVPVQVERKVKVPVPYPVKVEVEKKIPVPYPVKVPVKVYIPQPYPVEKKVEVKVRDYSPPNNYKDYSPPNNYKDYSPPHYKDYKSTYHKDSSYLKDPYPKESYPKESYVKDTNTYKPTSSDYRPHSYTYYTTQSTHDQSPYDTQSTHDQSYDTQSHDQSPYGTENTYPHYSQPPTAPNEHLYSVESAYPVPQYSQNEYQKQDSYYSTAEARIQPVQLDSDASATDLSQQFMAAVAPPPEVSAFQINVPDSGSQAEPMAFAGSDSAPQYDAGYQPMHLLHLHQLEEFHGISPEATGFALAHE